MNQNTNPKLAFQDIVQKILKHSGFPISNKIEIKSNEYHQFWELLSEGENASIYIVELLRIIDQTEYNKKVKNYNLECLLSSLLTICMFKNVDTVKKQRDYKEIKQNWEHHLIGSNKKQPMSNPHSISIVSNLHQMFENQQQEENNFIGFLIGSIAFLPDIYKVAKPENIEIMYDSLKQHYSLVETSGKALRMKNDSFYSFLLDERFDLNESAEFQFAYEYLTKQLRTRHRNSPPRVYHDSLIKFFKMIPFIAQDFPEQAEKSALSLLHMTKQLITLFSCETVDLLKSLLNQIEIFKRWPFPVGVLASELVEMLYQECKSRGSAFRNKVREEIPQIDFLDQQNSDSSMLSQQEQLIPLQSNNNNINMPQLKNDNPILQVFVFQENRISEASNVLQYAQHVFRQSSQQTIYSPHALRCYVCAQILQLQTRKFIDRNLPLTGLSDVQIFNLYCKLLIIVEKCDQLDSISDIELIYDNSFDEIIKELQKNNNKNQTEAQKDIQNIIREYAIPDFPVYYFHTVQQRPFMFTAPKQVFLKTDDRPTIAPIERLKQLVQNAYDNYMPLHSEPLRILVMGGDTELFDVCMLLGELYYQDPFLLRSLDIRVFIVPTTSNCALAQFLAVKDPWYQRYLYLPFTEDLLIPKLENIKDEAQKGIPEFTNVKGQLPLAQKAWALNTFLREANRAYNVRVYQIKIWQKNLSQGGVAMVQQKQGLFPKIVNDGLVASRLFFCSYVMFGAIAEFEQLREKSKDEKFQKMTFYDYKEKNLCKFQHLHVLMTTESTDMLGNIQKDEKIQVQLHNCKINNAYTDFFEGNMPMPHTDWLELSYISQENAKLFDNGLRQKNIFKKHNQEAVQNAFKSLFTNISITKLHAEELNKKPFSIIVDGNIYSDIVQFKITSTHLKKKRLAKIFPNKMQEKENPCDIGPIKNLNVPLMSFLPFKV